MTTDLQTVRPGERLDTAAQAMDRAGVRQLLVVDDGRLLGLISYRDIIRLVLDSGATATGIVAEHMDPDPVTVPPSTALADVIRMMLDSDLSAVPVTEDDRVVGVISEHDIVRLAGTLLTAEEAR
ncbi:MAG: CBS domain-containing protein [Longimicrobiales bacterium]|nr:CBS domain-containing protein [Longimicrobiales bacterium]